MQTVLLSIYLILIFFIILLYRKLHRTKEGKIKIFEARLNHDELLSYAEHLSQNHTLSKKAGNIDHLMRHLDGNYRYINATYKALSTSEVQRSVPAAEWLLDNFYLIEQQYKETKQNINRKFYRELPILDEGNFGGYPRIYAVIVELLSHNDSSADKNILIEFLNSYQSYATLKNAEIWAIPVILEIALIEIIRRQCELIRESMEEFGLAEEILKSPDGVEEALSKYIKEGPSTSLFEHLLMLMKRDNSDYPEVISAIDEKLESINMTAEKMIRAEYLKQTSRQMTMGNAVTSMRNVDSIDYDEVFENVSAVEKILMQDSAYGKMTDESKHYYRQKIENLSKRYHFSELEVTKRAYALSQKEEKHIGYYLITHPLNLSDAGETNKRFYYFINIGATIAISIAIALLMPGFGSAAAAFLLSLIPVSEIVRKVTDYIVMKCSRAVVLPKIELDDGEEHPAFVVISTLVPDEKRVLELLDQLEQQFLRNRQKRFYFGILGDLKDGNEEFSKDDAAIKNLAKTKIDELNQKYGNRFFFFLRKRVFANGKWSGWERKRGAIEEFVNLLGKDEQTSFDFCAGDMDSLPEIEYIITLDADTVLPRGAANTMVGAMVHPLNRPAISGGIVKSGYALLQPRVGISLESANGSVFSRIFAGQGGIDPYSGAVSDVYQDLFGEGIFTGKGIFDVSAYRSVLSGKIPDNRVLSHDLLEGSFLRAGLLSDVEVIDSYPTTYIAWFERMHRWIRGDWQLLPYFGKKITDKNGNRIENPLTFHAKWKILDNLRRSLISPVLAVILFLSFNLLSGHFWLWMILLFLTLASPLLLSSFDSLILRNYRFYGQKLHATIYYGLKGALYQLFYMILFLAHQAWFSLDAIVRTLYRLTISKKNLLSWVTAADVEKRLKNTLQGSLLKTWQSGVYGILLFLCASQYRIIAAVFGILFVSMSWISFVISKPIRHHQKSDIEDIIYIRKTARKIWRFFDDFCGEFDHYLPPDNYQEYPPNGIAHRTSPTNIGIYLASCFCAYDMGYISRKRLIEKIDLTITTIEQMEKWNGHLYNWYNTKNLHTLRPRYISTVDSGNFVGYLITVSEGLKSLSKPDYTKYLHGLLDTVRIEREELEGLFDELPEMVTGQEFQEFIHKHAQALSELPLCRAMIEDFQEELADAAVDPAGLIDRIEKLIDDTSFGVLYDDKRKLFSIGYNMEEERLTKSYYDLLASECRQTSYIAIAKGEVEGKHWSMLSRSLTEVDQYRGLVSWTGTMFEYLMPLLIMKDYENTLLNETYQFVLYCQKRYGKKREVPWGTSESGFFAFDIQLNYQYKAFGVPELGLKRGLSSDMVVAPYASLMALMLNVKSSVKNLKEIESLGGMGIYGFYEAIDFTPSRMLEYESRGIVKSFMSHHQGMSLLAINNVVNDNIMQKRFSQNVEMKSNEIILQERVPVKVILTKENKEKIQPLKEKRQQPVEIVRDRSGFNEPMVHLLSNGEYSILLNEKGQLWSKVNGNMINRYREDSVLTPYGSFVYIKREKEEMPFSNTLAPTYRKPDSYRTIFSASKAEYIRRDGSLETQTSICTASEDNAEVKSIKIINHGEEEEIVDLTSYLEVVLAKQEQDLAHPAFSNLFVKTEYVDEKRTLLANRRKRNPSDPDLVAFHTVFTENEMVGGISYETDRSKFLGRGNTPKNPNLLPLSNTTGSVLDPIMSIRVKLRIAGHESVTVHYITGTAENRQEAIYTAEKYQNTSAVRRAFELSFTRSQVEAGYLSLSAKDMQAVLSLGSCLINPSEKGKYQDLIAQNQGSQEDLWGFGISGDLPFLLCLVKDISDTAGLQKIMQAHEYYRMRGFVFDLVILNLSEGSYERPSSQVINELIASSHLRNMQNVNGGVFCVEGYSREQAELSCLFAYSSCIIDCSAELSSQLKPEKPVLPEQLVPKPAPDYPELPLNVPGGENGFGRFLEDGYQIILQNNNTPAPWVNVCANPEFGFVVSERGSMYTYFYNSREFKITPWNNDFVSDSGGEFFVIRDNETGKLNSITKYPISDDGLYAAEHKFGYSEFAHHFDGLEGKMTVFADVELPVKYTVITLTNRMDFDRQISLISYIEPVLSWIGRPGMVQADRNEDVVLLSNKFRAKWKDRQIFAALPENTTFTTKKSEFFDQFGQMSLQQKYFSDSAGTASCLAMMTDCVIPAGETAELTFIMGAYTKDTAAKQKQFDVHAELERVKQFWNSIFKIKVHSPDRTLDIFVNQWLLYQTISCRLFARSAFYQSGGAFGFRDQLQDVLALLQVKPELARNQILLHSRHQFLEGDVQHWWHPDGQDTNSGVRTRFSDDLLWLVYVTSCYVETTEDFSILEETTPYIEDEPLPQGEDERYRIPKVSSVSESIYQHCIRAAERALHFGEHGLLLMGSGDWNDGMNTVGNQGKGESVWLTFFMIEILNKFIPICEHCKDSVRAEQYKEIRSKLIQAADENAWDGNWYRRAYFDDGMPLGSIENEECKIDSISQSWAVISNRECDKQKQDRLERAMDSLEQYLVDYELGIIKLLTPPFENGREEPGYIKAYVAGVRENGGQYTHAAVWAVLAYLKLGRKEKAYQLLTMINPANHANTYTECMRYKAEPYVMAADVYSVYPQEGRGGWTWYTGAAGWYFRVLTEEFYGIKKRGERLFIQPCIPQSWDGFEIDYRFLDTLYHIKVVNGEGEEIKLKVDNCSVPAMDGILLVNDKQKHQIEVIL